MNQSLLIYPNQDRLPDNAFYLKVNYDENFSENYRKYIFYDELFSEQEVLSFGAISSKLEALNDVCLDKLYGNCFYPTLFCFVPKPYINSIYKYTCFETQSNFNYLIEFDSDIIAIYQILDEIQDLADDVKYETCIEFDTSKKWTREQEWRFNKLFRDNKFIKKSIIHHAFDSVESEIRKALNQVNLPLKTHVKLYKPFLKVDQFYKEQPYTSAPYIEYLITHELKF